MGGKNKSSQRTKNNARPSSSGRSAELLGSMPAGFVGFSGATMDSKSLPLAFPLSPESPDGDLETEFQLVIKKLSKKDPITKTKALQELSELVKEKSLEEVLKVLPYWARLYRILTNDTEHKVRETTQTTHGIIVDKCGRSIAPYLKQIIPTWLTAQYDNFAPAASSAQASLQGAFPESKLPEVISFCKAEVMSHISTNLIGDSQAINNKALPPEVIEMRYQRLTMGTLQGFDYFTKHLPDKHSEYLWTEQIHILDSKKFWTLASDKCSQIRSAWFGVISRQIERFPELLGEAYGAKITKVLVNNLIEKDPLVAMQLWECFLLLTAHMKGWYSWVDKKEQLGERILDVLENGGWGNATHLASIILPLLANLPEEMLTKEFYSKFFVAMVNGLNKKAVLASKSHRQSCLTTVGECLKYVSIHQIDTFAVEIVTAALRTWLERILESPYEIQTRHNIIKYSATCMVSLIKYWLRQIKENTNSEKYNQLVRNFWQNKCSTIVHQIEKLGVDHAEVTKSIEGHILLLQTLSVSFDQGTKKRVTIKFKVDEETEVDKSNTEDKSESDSEMQEAYKHNLNQLIYTTCSQYLLFADQKQISLPVFCPLYTLLNEFNSKDLFVAIQHSFPRSIGNEESLHGLYERVFKKWMSDDTMRCKEVVHMTFLLLPHMNSDEKRVVFKSFNQFVPSVVEQIISMCLSYPYNSYDYVSEWMKSEVVDLTLASICKRLVCNVDSHSKNLLLMAFSQDSKGDIIISAKACSGILTVLREALKDLESPYLDMCASLASHLVTVLLTEDKSDAYKELLLQMFQLNAVAKPNGNLSQDTYYEVLSSWHEGLSTMDEDDRTTFIETAITHLQQSLLVELNETHRRDFMELILGLMSDFNVHSKAEEVLPEVVTIAKALFVEGRDCSDIQSHALTYDCLTGRISFFCGKDEVVSGKVIKDAVVDIPKDLDQMLLKAYIQKSLIRVKYLQKVVFRKLLIPSVHEEDVEQTQPWASTILSDEFVKELYLEALHDCTVLHSLEEAYSFHQSYTYIKFDHESILLTLKEIAEEMSAENKKKYMSSLSLKASKKGFYWSIARKCFEKLSNQVYQEDPFSQNYDCLVSAEKTCGYIHPDDQVALAVNHSDAEPRVSYVDFMNEDWHYLVRLTAEIYNATNQVNQHCESIPKAKLDEIFIAMCKHILGIEAAKTWWGASKVVLVAHATLKLVKALQGFIATIESTPADCRSSMENHRLNEWNFLWNVDCTKHLYSLILSILEEAEKMKKLSMTHVIHISGLLEVFDGLDWRTTWGSAETSAVTLSRIRKISLKVLSLRPIDYQRQLLAYRLLKAMVEPLVAEDMDKLTQWVKAIDECDEANYESVEKPPFSLQPFQAILAHMGEEVNRNLSAARLGESSCSLEPNSDAYSLTMSYLLLIEFILDICAKAHNEVQQQYIEFFRNENYIELVMINCMRLLPSVIIDRAREPTQAPIVPPHYTLMFSEPFTLKATDHPDPRHIEALACRCMYLTLAGVGAVVARGWYGTLAGRLSKTIDNIVSAHITPGVYQQHSALVFQKASSIPDVVITTLKSSNEFVAEYNLDGAKMELQIEMSSNHPLSIPKVRSVRAPVNHSQWISFYLSYQNGSVVEAVRSWSLALARKVETITPCYICYARLHPASGEMPKVFCHTCKNRFHNRCIYKWFRTSAKASCPVCRSLF